MHFTWILSRTGFIPTLLNHLEGRSGQTAMHILLMGMVRLMAPILSFTSEEIWSYLPRKWVDGESVHLSLFDEPEDLNFDDIL